MMTMIYGIGIAMALLAGGAIGLLLTVAHYQRSAAREQRYEQEIAEVAELYAVARASLKRYGASGPRNNTPRAP